MSKYQNAVSLGFFCSPALELNALNLRKCSLPFDWILTADFKNVLALIENRFEGLLAEDKLYQLKEYPGYYRNIQYGIDFYHEFDEFKTFDSQIAEIQSKYQRRIERFYQIIQEPTLFVRYMSSKAEVEFVNREYEKIIGLLKSFNRDNDIVFVANRDDALGNIAPEIRIWYADKDKNDVVARAFLKKQPAMKEYLLQNVETSETKPHALRKKSFVSKAFRKGCHILGLYYHHKNSVSSK